VALNPVDDAYVAEGSPTSNFGSAALLQTDSGPVFESYLKFDLRSLGGRSISRATLRMWVINASTSPNQIKDVSNNAWTESGITFANKPAKGATVTAFTPNGGSRAWKEVVITSAVAARAGSFLSIAIDSAGTDGYQFNSAEATTNRVELVIVAGTAVRPTPAVVGAPDDLPSTGGSPAAGDPWLWLLIGGAGVLALGGVAVIRSGFVRTRAEMPTGAARIAGPRVARSPKGGSGVAFLVSAIGVVAICAVSFLIARTDTRR